MSELISEAITPHAGTFSAEAMGRGTPGLPTGFDWHGDAYEIVEVRRTWKYSSREGSSAGGDLYLRRHYYELFMSDGATWTVYFVRQTPRSGNPKQRWFLYSVERPQPPSEETDHAP